ncbi:hypothetical protein [Acinetobacter sp. ACNIH2]|uniref:hypothetical protein n=1 Tax=Acinetobacter sp. ACNIH2 TaxID=1758189 RepID=UPI0013151F27|nr:hypothetical protein [Acinetobacter sp. ACNIH2]
MHEGRKINYSVFNKLAGLQQNQVVENKRLGSVLAHIQQQHEVTRTGFVGDIFI